MNKQLRTLILNDKNMQQCISGRGDKEQQVSTCNFSAVENSQFGNSLQYSVISSLRKLPEDIEGLNHQDMVTQFSMYDRQDLNLGFPRSTSYENQQSTMTAGANPYGHLASNLATTYLCHSSPRFYHLLFLALRTIIKININTAIGKDVIIY